MNSKPLDANPVAKRPGRPPVDRREEILEAAKGLYETIGFEKTTMGDVAKALGMSPANLYRSFSNRQAIDEAIAARMLSLIEDRAWREARVVRPANLALSALSRAVLEETRTRMFSQARIHHLCAVAAREQWPVVHAYLDSLRGALRHVIMEGQRSGEFSRADPEMLAETVCSALTKVWHPQMVEAYAAEDLTETSDRICNLLVDGMRSLK